MKRARDDDPRPHKRHQGILGEPTQAGLLELPAEILDTIILECGLDAQEVARVRRTCRALRRVVTDPHDVVRWQCLAGIVKCAEQGFTDAVRRLLAEPPEHHGPNAFSQVLLVAIREGHIDMVRLILADGRLAIFPIYLRKAIDRRRLGIFRTLLADERMGINGDAVHAALRPRDPAYICALHEDPRFNLVGQYPWVIDVACHVGHPDIVRAVLGFEGINPARLQSRCFRTLVTRAQTAGFGPILQMLLDDGRADVRLQTMYMIRQAANHTDRIRLEILLSSERVVAALNKRQIVDYAAGMESTYLIKELLRRPAFEPRHFGTAVCAALNAGRPTTTHLLLENPRVVFSEQRIGRVLRVAFEDSGARCFNVIAKDERFDPGRNDNELLMWACGIGDITAVRRLLRDKRVDPTARNHRALQLAIDNGSNRVACALLKDGRADPTANDNHVLRAALRSQTCGLLDALLKDGRVDLSVDNNAALRTAVRKGWTDTADQLLNDQRVDPRDMDNEAICVAASHGLDEMVILLLIERRADPTARDNQPLIDAARYGRHNVVKMLLDDPRVKRSSTLSSALETAIGWARRNLHRGIMSRLVAAKLTRKT